MSGGPAPLLEVTDLRRHFLLRQGLGPPRRLRAVDGVSLSLAAGETLGLVGESGCGKSTLARCLVRLIDPDGGRIRFAGRDVTRLAGRGLRELRAEVQIVLQDALGALNPRRRVGEIIAAPLRLHGVGRAAAGTRVAELLEEVGLGSEHLRRHPHELSGGEAQRVGIARALAPRPRLLVLDEPVSALDVSIQAQVVNLLADLQARLGVAYLFIAHDLGVVRQIANRIAVMYLGRIVELAEAEELCRRPRHPYTAALLDAVPIPDPRANRARRRTLLSGEPPSPIEPPAGCRFHPRCPRASAVCISTEPALVDHGGGHLAACHHPLVSATDR